MADATRFYIDRRWISPEGAGLADIGARCTRDHCLHPVKIEPQDKS